MYGKDQLDIGSQVYAEAMLSSGNYRDSNFEKYTRRIMNVSLQLNHDCKLL